LTADVGGERVVIDAPAREGEARELVGRARRVDVLVEGREERVAAGEPRLRVVERKVQLVRRLVVDARVDVERVGGAGVERRALSERERGGADAREVGARAEVEVEDAAARADEGGGVELLVELSLEVGGDGLRARLPLVILARERAVDEVAGRARDAAARAELFLEDALVAEVGLELEEGLVREIKF
jgi:hypothetical protein